MPATRGTDPQRAEGSSAPGGLPDRLTLVAISSLAYIVAVAFHEHLGHATACALLGSHPTEMGAFYIECDDSKLTSVAIRLVAIAGPLVSLAIGTVCLPLAQRLTSPAAFYFTWLLGTLGLMDATGYPLFSGVSGLGDLGTTADGALRGVTPEWAWRAVEAVAGLIAYVAVVRYAARVLAPRLSGAGLARIRGARLTATWSYFTGAAVYLAIGVLNPHGLVIVITSALASSMGGTSGLLWMARLLKREPSAQGPGIYFGRSWRWIIVSVALTVGYAVVFGPTLRP
jgi:hypothetical protein